jgi:hypothetical protein
MHNNQKQAMQYLKDFLELVAKATSPNSIDKHTRGDCIICYKDGKIVEINISASLIQRFYHKNEKRDYCPAKQYVMFIEKQFPFEPTESMMNGIYLETGLLGEGADGVKVADLPRDKRTGKKKSAQQRIDTHLALWEMRKELHGIMVIPSGDMKNIQLRHKTEWEYHTDREIKVFVYTTIDLLSPIKDKGFDYPMAVIDVKGTGDINSTFGEYCWGTPQHMDHFQGILYSWVHNLPFVYALFDWSKEPNYKLIPLITDVEDPDPIKANEARTRIKEMKETINNFIKDLINYEEFGWYTNPTANNCNNCPNIYCEEHGKTIPV